MAKTILVFGGLAAVILLLFELNKLTFLRTDDLKEVFVVLSGVLFILVGFLFSRMYQRPNRLRYRQSRANLTRQEHRVLSLMTDGLSNGEIAGQLFIAESTVKSHVSNILMKLKARRRTEAIRIGRDLDLV